MSQPPPPPPPPSSSPPPPPPPGAPPTGGVTPTPSGDASSKPKWLVPAIVAVVVVALAGVGAFVVFGGSESAGAQVVAESVTDPGADPFMSSMAVVEVAEFPSDVEAVIDANREQLGSSGDVLVALGTQPGLYGGSNEETVCDAATLVDFLGDHAAEAAAWAGVLGITADKIPDYVAGLASVVLTTDTLVINHGFVGGEATPRTAVLQAGTAVMVDDRGVPRVKCGCGNPLLPSDTRSPNLGNVADPWEGFDADRVAVIDPGPPAESIDVIDVDNGETFVQPIGAHPESTGGEVPSGDEIVLLPDGLGVVSFGEPEDEVISTLTDLLGSPASTGQVRRPGGVIVENVTAWESFPSSLAVAFENGVFTAYSLGRLSEYSPTPEQPETVSEDLDFATPQGISRTSTEADMYAAFAGGVAGCATPGGASNYVAGGYLFQIFEGVIIAIAGHQGTYTDCTWPR